MIHRGWRPPSPRGLDLRPLDLHLATTSVAQGAAGMGTDGSSTSGSVRVAAAESAPSGVFGFPGTDGGTAGRAAASWLREGLARGRYEPRHGVLAIHERRHAGHRQMGLIAGVTVADIRAGVVRPHEQTQADRAGRIAAFVDAAGADLSPVLLTYRARSDLDARIADAVDRVADVVIAGPGGTRHRIWVVDDPRACAHLRLAARSLRQVTVVDGHHRIAAALDGAERAGDEGTEGVEVPVLAELVPDRDLRMVGFDRLVHATDRALFRELAKVADVSELGAAPPRNRPDGLFEAYVAVADRWVRAVFRDPPRHVPDSLPVRLLQDRLLRPVLGLADPRTDGRLRYLPGVGDLRRIGRAVQASGVTAFVPRAVTVDELQTVAERGGLLPPKSTYLVAKTGPGIVVHLHRAEDFDA